MIGERGHRIEADEVPIAFIWMDVEVEVAQAILSGQVDVSIEVYIERNCTETLASAGKVQFRGVFDPVHRAELLEETIGSHAVDHEQVEITVETMIEEEVGPAH